METRRSQLDQLEKSITCPITGEIFLNPVIITCEHTFEEEALKKWLENKDSCPTCRKPVSIENVIRNLGLKDAVESILEEKKFLIPEQYFSATQFVEYIKKKDVKSIEKIVSNKPKLIDELIIDGRSVFHLAVLNGNLSVVTCLAKHAIEKDILNRRINNPQDSLDGATPALIAAKWDEVSATILKFLIEQGANVDKSTKEGITPLMAAIISNDATKISILIQSGKFLKPNKMVNSGDFAGQAALHLAAENCHDDVFEELLSIKDININIRNHKQQTPLFIAAKNNQVNKVKKLLALDGINIESSDENNETAEAIAKSYGYQDIVALFNSKEIKFKLMKTNLLNDFVDDAIELFAEIYEKCDEDAINTYLMELKPFIFKEVKTPLSFQSFCRRFLAFAANKIITRNDQHFLLELLKSQPIDDFICESILREAIQKNQIAIVKTVLNQFKELINSKDQQGNTPLCWALQQKWVDNIETISYLLENNADITSPNKLAMTPLVAALDNNKLDAAKLLLKHAISHKKNLNLTQATLDNKKNALILATNISDDDEIFNQLLTHDEIDVNEKGDQGVSALFIAARNGDLSKVLALLTCSGINVDITNQYGMTPYKIAQKNGHHHIAAIFNCYHLIIHLLKDEKYSFNTNLNYLLYLDQRSLDAVITCLANQGYDKKKCKHIFSFLMEMTQSQLIEVNAVKKHYFFRDKSTAFNLDLDILNRLFDIASVNLKLDSNQIDWKKKIRHTALNHLLVSLKDSTIADQDKKLDLVRSQTIFSKHRHPFLSFGRTATVVMIDALKKDLQKKMKKIEEEQVNQNSANRFQ